MTKTKRVILLVRHNFISPGCNTNIDGKLITEFDMTSYLVAEVLYAHTSSKGRKLASVARNILMIVLRTCR